MKRTIMMAAVAAMVLAGCEGDERAVTKEARRAMRATSEFVVPMERAPAASQADASVGAVAEAPVAKAELEPLALAHECAGAVDHLGRARTLREAGDLKGALLEARRALHHEASSEALEEAGLVARRAGERNLALRLYLALGEKVPAEALPMIKVARLAAQGKDWEGVRSACAEAILRDPTAAEAYHLRGRAQLNLKHLPGAIRDFRRAAALDTGHGWALNNLGYAYLLANEPEKAVEPLQEAARLLPEVALVQNNLGIAYEKSGDRESAREAYAQALALRPEYVKAMVNKARLTQLASASPFSMSDAVLADGFEIESGVASPAEQLESLHEALEVAWPEDPIGEASAEQEAELERLLEGLMAGTRVLDDDEELRIETGGDPLELPELNGGEL